MSDSLEKSPLGMFQEYCRQGQLAYQVDDLGTAFFYPRLCAPGNGSRQLTWKKSQGLGTVYATTTVFPRGGESYDVSLVDIDEGFRMMGRVENVEPMSVHIGMRVKVRMTSGDDEYGAYPVFDPMETEQ